MKENTPTNNAQKYLHQPPYTKLDIVAAAIIVIAIALMLWRAWFFPILGVGIVILIFSRSARVSDQEYEQLLQYLLLHNPLKEARSEQYETLVHYLVYDGSIIDDRIMKLYDIGADEVVRGFDQVLRSRFFYLISLTLTDTHCHILGCRADVVKEEVTMFSYDLSKAQTLHVIKKTTPFGTEKRQLFYLEMPDGALLPVQTNSVDYEALQNYFADCCFTQK